VVGFSGAHNVLCMVFRFCPTLEDCVSVKFRKSLLVRYLRGSMSKLETRQFIETLFL